MGHKALRPYPQAEKEEKDFSSIFKKIRRAFLDHLSDA
jgi:hypothetical protein